MLVPARFLEIAYVA